jgi:hypothetical protein
MTEDRNERDLLARIWALLGGSAGDLSALSLEGTPQLPTLAYDVNALATASIAAATLAVAQVQAVRTAQPMRRVRVDRGHAAAAFRSERYQSAVGWRLPAVWDPIAGDYETRDGWIRLHTNYRNHREAALRALGVAEERDEVARAVARWEGDALETAVVGEGGCAAFMRSPEDWARHPQGEAVAGESLVATTLWPSAAPAAPAAVPDVAAGGTEQAPLAGVRVLDLTRVIAGPVCTRALAAFGADVLRIDPPGFEEVGALLGDVTAGKRRAALDLRSDAGRAAFERLVGDRLEKAHILVHGYRSDALPRLGFDRDRLIALNPSLVIVCHDAYGWTGPWAARRGFDSLVQMSCGIAWRGRELAGTSRPTPLSAQALDHATGYLLAASACRGLARLLVDQQASETRLSLAGTAACLMGLRAPTPPVTAELPLADVEPWLEDADTAFGRMRRVRYPGVIEGVTAQWKRPAGPLGVDAARWS